jgi:hypothetical protein
MRSFTMKIDVNQMEDEDMLNFSQVKSQHSKELLLEYLVKPEYVRLICKADLNDSIGSMFVIIRDEP